ncbi:Hypothetical Protein FCC1311_043442 [Hondaea fermentalgiana]|uniref:Phytase-like domain-containing protein n=1 Tax=Hondaea fermentalgiana TaxID=2315210 RepID=A0A2R5GIK8_9STRA|nr:Hypothetical Protein FCC1311_043442 [Hondaea fermentalgiana]|eukprot:GBG28121.1 Hypothetical Protein FCC1311_043442 [Hondaea fermentalgiana]
MAPASRRRSVRTASGPGQVDDDSVFGVQLQHQCEDERDQGCNKLSAVFAGVVEIPTNYTDSGRIVPAVDEVSGVSHGDGFATLVAVGDAGRLYQLTMPDASSVYVKSSVSLEVPPGEDFVDAESVAVICKDSKVPSCSLDDPDTTVIVGSERNENTQARIAEYFVNGTIKDLNFVSPSLLAAIGLESESQEINGGFEAMSASLDHNKIIFTTEDAMPVDASVSERIRRLVVWDRSLNTCLIFRYDVQHKDAEAGVVDVTFLDDDAQFVSIVERMYETEWKVDRISVLYTQLKSEMAISLDCAADGGPAMGPEELAQRLHELTPLRPRERNPIFTFPAGSEALSDNFEGAVLLPPNRFILVSDNNESPGQHTYISTLLLTNEVDSVLTWAFWGGLAIAGIFLFLVCCFCGPRRKVRACLGACLGRETAYVDLDDDNETTNADRVNTEVELPSKRDALVVL